MSTMNVQNSDLNGREKKEENRQCTTALKGKQNNRKNERSKKRDRATQHLKNEKAFSRRKVTRTPCHTYERIKCVHNVLYTYELC